MAGYRNGQSVNGYKVVSVVTEGNYAASYKAMKDGREFFLKEYIDPTEGDPKFLSFVQHQDLIYARLQKTKLHCVENLLASFTHEYRYHQIKPFYKAEDLRAFLTTHNNLEERLFLCRNWLGVMRELKNNNIVHQDLKPEQILMVENSAAGRLGRIMVFADFDWAIIDGIGVKPVMTPGYATQEHCLGSELPDYRSDLFQTGIVLYEILTTTLPFGKPNNSTDLVEYQERIKKSKYKAVCEIQPVVPDWCGEIIAAMLRLDKLERPTIEQVIDAWDAKSARSLQKTRSVSEWIRLRHHDSGCSMTLTEAVTHIKRSNFHIAFRPVLTASRQPLAAYLPSDDSMICRVDRGSDGWAVVSPSSTTNKVRINGIAVGSTPVKITDGDAFEIYSSKSSSVVGRLLVEFPLK